MNATVNRTDCASLLNSRAGNIGGTFAYCLILVVSLVGNSCIATIVYKTKTMRKPINLFIVSMAMSDLLYPIFFLPRSIAGFHVDSWLISGPLGQALCNLVPFSASVSTAVTIQSMILIAVDRFGAVVFPLGTPLISSKMCPLAILATWIVAMAINWPYLFAYKLIQSPGHVVRCLGQWSEIFEGFSMKYYVLLLFIVLFYIPIFALAILYSIIFLKLKSKKIPGEHTAIAEEQREKRNRNVLKLAVAIVLVFVVCWLPWSIINVLILFLWNRFPCGIQRYSFILFLISNANCAINPCICFMFSENYRKHLKKLFFCRKP